MEQRQTERDKGTSDKQKKDTFSTISPNMCASVYVSMITPHQSTKNFRITNALVKSPGLDTRPIL